LFGLAEKSTLRKRKNRRVEVSVASESRFNPVSKAPAPANGGEHGGNAGEEFVCHEFGKAKSVKAQKEKHKAAA
jgi:hypothetical protein